jgi:hypothetical protein
MSGSIQRQLTPTGHPERWLLTDPAWPGYSSSIRLDAQEVVLIDRFLREHIEKYYRCTHEAFLSGTFKSVIQSQFGAPIWAEVIAELKRRAIASPQPSPAPKAAPTPAPAVTAPVATTPAVVVSAPVVASAPITPTVAPVSAVASTAPVVGGRAAVALQDRNRANVGLVAGLLSAVEGFDIAAFLRRLKANDSAAWVVGNDLGVAEANALRDRLRAQGLAAEVVAA